MCDRNKKIMSFENIFVTVGTTEFDSLIKLLNTEEIVLILKKLNCKNLTIQMGRGQNVKFDSKLLNGIKLNVYGLKPTIIDDINSADLVISHAGAGTCIDVLSAGKSLIVVVNEDLMDNHQTELAEQLHQDGYLIYCTQKSLKYALNEIVDKKFKKYEKGNVELFVKQLDKLMGFDF